MKASIASLFGLTQRQMAMALGIGLSQWSMYECGKRNLPPRAQHLLNEMTAHLHAFKVAPRKKLDDATIQNRILHIKSLLEDNAIAQRSLAKKIAAVTKKDTAVQQYARFEDFVNTRKDDKKTHDTFIWVEANKKQRQADSHYADLLFRYELRQALLFEEQKLLESRLAGLAKSQYPKP